MPHPPYLARGWESLSPQVIQPVKHTFLFSQAMNSVRMVTSSPAMAVAGASMRDSSPTLTVTADVGSAAIATVGYSSSAPRDTESAAPALNLFTCSPPLDLVSSCYQNSSWLEQ